MKRTITLLLLAFSISISSRAQQWGVEAGLLNMGEVEKSSTSTQRYYSVGPYFRGDFEYGFNDYLSILSETGLICSFDNRFRIHYKTLGLQEVIAFKAQAYSGRNMGLFAYVGPGVHCGLIAKTDLISDFYKYGDYNRFDLQACIGAGAQYNDFLRIKFEFCQGLLNGLSKTETLKSHTRYFMLGVAYMFE